MSGAAGHVALYALLPLSAIALGAALALLRPPGPRVRSGLQHFAAGVVFSVASVELLPEIVAAHTPGEVAITFSLGVLLMLGLSAVLPQAAVGEAGAAGRTPLPLTLLAAVGIDVFIDGLLLGIGFALGEHAGRLLALALTLEALSLGLATALVLADTALRRRLAFTIMLGIGLLFLAGGVLGAALLSSVSHHTLSLVLAFALAALLFLVTEELLAGAHKTPDVPLVTALFFVGFLLFLMLGMLE